MRVRVWMTPAWHRSHGAHDYAEAIEFSKVGVYDGTSPVFPGSAGALYLTSVRSRMSPHDSHPDVVLPWHMVCHVEAVSDG